MSVFLLSPILCTPVLALNSNDRWYSGYQSLDPYQPGDSRRYNNWNYYGAHTHLTTPNYIVSLDTTQSSTMSTNFLNIDIPDTYTDYSTTWWIQVGYTHGTDESNVFHNGYTTYEEYGISRKDGSQSAHEYMESDQPLSTGWDYYVRWDPASNAWKTNINGTTHTYLIGFPNRGHIAAEGEVNQPNNKNWGQYTSNSYYDGASTWYSFDSTFKPVTSIGSYVSGTPTNYTVSR